jgi:hypothetical protein
VGEVPLVKRAMERLGAQILHMDEGFGVAASPAGRSVLDANASEGSEEL